MTTTRNNFITVFTVVAAWLSAAPTFAQFSMLQTSEGPIATSGATAFGIESADLDGDGKPDIAVSCLGSGNINVYRNVSNGTGPMETQFADPLEMTLGTGAAYNLTLTDLNKDAKPEILIANTGSSEITILPNISTPGRLAFATALHITCPGAPYAITACDLNMDGYSEMIATCHATIAVFRNSTASVGVAITFDAYTSLTDATNWRDVMCADMDGDARVDIVAGGSDRVSVYPNISATRAATLSFAAPVVSMTARNTNTMDIGDLDGDYQPDVVTANWPSGDFTVLRNATSQGTIAFAAPQFIPAMAPPGIALGDFDQDGKLDVITMVDGMGWNLAEAFRNTSPEPGVITFNTPQTFTPVSEKVIVDDFDGDGIDDFAGVNDAANHIAVWVHDDRSLPIYITDVSAYCGEDGNAWIDWSASPKSNATSYVIERTLDGQHFEEIAKIDAQPEGSTSVYSVSDSNPANQTVYYRILTFHATDAYTSSSLYPLTPCNDIVTDFTCVFPNPVADVMHFKFSVTTDIPMHMQVIDMSMKNMIQKEEMITSGTRTYAMDVSSLPTGSYMFILRFGNLPPHVCQFEKL